MPAGNFRFSVKFSCSWKHVYLTVVVEAKHAGSSFQFLCLCSVSVRRFMTVTDCATSFYKSPVVVDVVVVLLRPAWTAELLHGLIPPHGLKMIGSPDLLAFTGTEGFGEEDLQEAQSLPEELSIPLLPSSNPWTSTAQFHTDFILVAEFSEQVRLSLICTFFRESSYVFRVL